LFVHCTVYTVRTAHFPVVREIGNTYRKWKYKQITLHHQGDERVYKLSVNFPNYELNFITYSLEIGLKLNRMLVGNRRLGASGMLLRASLQQNYNRD